MNMIYDNLGEMRQRLELFGKSGALEADILFKAMDLLKKHKGIRIFPKVLEIQTVPWMDPLNKDDMIIVVDSLVRMEMPGQEPLEFVEQVDFRFFRKSFAPVCFETDNENLKKLYNRIPDIDYAAWRIMGEMCQRLKYAKDQYLIEARNRSRIWQGFQF